MGAQQPAGVLHQLSLERHREGKGGRVQRPGTTVEVAGQEPAGVVLAQRVHADGLGSLEVLGDDLVGQRQVPLGPAGRGAAVPAARNGRGVAGLAAAGVGPADRVHLVLAAKQPPHQRDLVRKR